MSFLPDIAVNKLFFYVIAILALTLKPALTVDVGIIILNPQDFFMVKGSLPIDGANSDFRKSLITKTNYLRNRLKTKGFDSTLFFFQGSNLKKQFFSRKTYFEMENGFVLEKNGKPVLKENIVIGDRVLSLEQKKALNPVIVYLDPTQREDLDTHLYFIKNPFSNGMLWLWSDERTQGFSCNRVFEQLFTAFPDAKIIEESCEDDFFVNTSLEGKYFRLVEELKNRNIKTVFVYGLSFDSALKNLVFELRDKGFSVFVPRKLVKAADYSMINSMKEAGVEILDQVSLPDILQ